MSTFDFHWKKNETPFIELIEFDEQNTFIPPFSLFIDFLMSKEVVLYPIFHS